MSRENAGLAQLRRTIAESNTNNRKQESERNRSGRVEREKEQRIALDEAQHRGRLDDGGQYACLLSRERNVPLHRRTGSPNNGALCFCRAFFYWKDLFTHTWGSLPKWPRRLSTPSPSSRQANTSTFCSLPKQMRNSCDLKCQAWRLGRRLAQKVLLGGRDARLGT